MEHSKSPFVKSIAGLDCVKLQRARCACRTKADFVSTEFFRCSSIPFHKSENWVITYGITLDNSMRVFLKSHKYSMTSLTITSFAMLRKEPCIRLSGYLDEINQERFADKDVINEQSGDQKLPGPDFALLYDSEPSMRMRAKRLEAASFERSFVVTNAERILAFAMARHTRLGSESAAFMISKDILRVIFGLLNSEILFLFGGIGAKDSSFSDSWSLDLSKYNASWNELAPLPRPVWGASCCEDSQNGRIYLIGGKSKSNSGESISNKSVFVYHVRVNRWEERENILIEPRQGSSCLIYQEKLFILGGHFRERNDEKEQMPGPDLVLSLPDLTLCGTLPFRPFSEDFWQTKTFSVSSFLIVFCFSRKMCIDTSSERYDFVQTIDPSQCCNQLMYLDLDESIPEWHGKRMILF